MKPIAKTVPPGSHAMEQHDKPVLCLTFDNMGEAHDVCLGKASVPNMESPAIKVGFPNILRLLAKYDLCATFFVEGWSALHYGDVVESILPGGHHIGCTDGSTKSSLICPSVSPGNMSMTACR
jgi:peptidoglycan/xylan/chitin deacetylase (PgdA/CDA1 family)